MPLPMALCQVLPRSRLRNTPPANLPPTILAGREQYSATRPVLGSAPPQKAWMVPPGGRAGQGFHVRPASPLRSTAARVAAYQNLPPPAGSKKKAITCPLIPFARLQVLPASSLRKVPAAELTSRTFPPGPIAGRVDCGVP